MTKLTLEAMVRGFLSSPNDIASVRAEMNERAVVTLQAGVGAGKADKLFSDTRTLSASSSEDLDLAGGLADPFGVTLGFARIKAIFIHAAEGNTNDVVIGGAASNTFIGPFGGATHKAAVRPGGLLMLACADATAWPVTAGTGDLLKIANGGSGTPVTYDIVLVGVSE